MLQIAHETSFKLKYFTLNLLLVSLLMGTHNTNNFLGVFLSLSEKHRTNLGLLEQT